jgi:hypothetical protein
MAVGLGVMTGFALPRNFRVPYASLSVTDFWRRWHMSLSAWLRDYVYIPLGGNRVSSVRTYVNLWIVFLLCGLWHGASWTFVIWGAYHGLLLVLERAGLRRLLSRLPNSIAHLYTRWSVFVGWVWFAQTVSIAQPSCSRLSPVLTVRASCQCRCTLRYTPGLPRWLWRAARTMAVAVPRLRQAPSGCWGDGPGRRRQRLAAGLARIVRQGQRARALQSFATTGSKRGADSAHRRYLGPAAWRRHARHVRIIGSRSNGTCHPFIVAKKASFGDKLMLCRAGRQYFDDNFGYARTLPYLRAASNTPS